MGHIKRVLIFMLSGAIVGEVIATIVAPSFITWWNTPGVGAPQAICDLPAIFHKSIHDLILGQLIGAVLGAAIAMILGIAVSRGVARRARATSEESAKA
jgi:gas vesicle protein